MSRFSSSQFDAEDGRLYNLLRLCLCSHGAAVQRGARFGPGGVAGRRRNGVSEVQRRRASVPSHRQNLQLWTQGSGETWVSTLVSSTFQPRLE